MTKKHVVEFRNGDVVFVIADNRIHSGIKLSKTVHAAKHKSFKAETVIPVPTLHTNGTPTPFYDEEARWVNIGHRTYDSSWMFPHVDNLEDD